MKRERLQQLPQLLGEEFGKSRYWGSYSFRRSQNLRFREVGRQGGVFILYPIFCLWFLAPYSLNSNRNVLMREYSSGYRRNQQNHPCPVSKPWPLPCSLLQKAEPCEGETMVEEPGEAWSAPTASFLIYTGFSSPHPHRTTSPDSC